MKIAQYNKEVTAMLAKIPTLQPEKGMYAYSVMTKAGKLFITMHEEYKIGRNHIFGVYCRFEDPAKAKEIVSDKDRLNDFSGKYNFHSRDWEYLQSSFINEITKLIQ